LGEGPATLAIRPEDVVLQRMIGEDGAVVHRVTDFGTHLSVELRTLQGFRLKAMTEPAQGWVAGMYASLHPRKFSVYRDGRLCALTAQTSGIELPVKSQQLEPA
jgi:putative spermidine/putrescine transport system ATP-binding protein